MKVKMLVIIALCALPAAAPALQNEEAPERIGIFEEPAYETGSLWQMPESDLDPKWGTDVLISPSDSVFSVSLARDPSTGNLFAVLSRLSGTAKGVSVHFSSNGGLSWSNTITSSSTGRGVSSAMVMGNYCYYAYSTSGGLRIKRVSRATGANVNMGNGAAYIDILTTTTDTITEVSMAELYTNTQLCLATIHKDGKYRMFWTYDTGGVSWTQFTSPESSAKRGLDIYGNYPYSDYLLFSSYYNKANQLRVLGLGPGADWDTLVTSGVDSNAYFTAVGAYRDTVLAAYETKYLDHYLVAYGISYNGGSNWSINRFLSDPDSHTFCPDVAMRGGGGIGVSYYQLHSSFAECRRQWRPYNSTVWWVSRYISLIPSYFHQPSIEYLDDGHYGIAYISNTLNLNKAYFDRSDWVVGVEDEPESPEEFTVQSLKLKVAGNIINYQIPQNGMTTLKIYNLLGQEVRTLVNGFKGSGVYSLQWDGRDAGNRKVASGVYLVRLVSGDKAATGKMVIVR